MRCYFATPLTCTPFHYPSCSRLCASSKSCNLSSKSFALSSKSCTPCPSTWSRLTCSTRPCTPSCVPCRPCEEIGRPPVRKERLLNLSDGIPSGSFDDRRKKRTTAGKVKRKQKGTGSKGMKVVNKDKVEKIYEKTTSQDKKGQKGPGKVDDSSRDYSDKTNRKQNGSGERRSSKAKDTDLINDSGKRRPSRGKGGQSITDINGSDEPRPNHGKDTQGTNQSNESSERKPSSREDIQGAVDNWREPGRGEGTTDQMNGQKGNGQTGSAGNDTKFSNTIGKGRYNTCTPRVVCGCSRRAFTSNTPPYRPCTFRDANAFINYNRPVTASNVSNYRFNNYYACGTCGRKKSALLSPVQQMCSQYAQHVDYQRSHTDNYRSGQNSRYHCNFDNYGTHSFNRETSSRPVTAISAQSYQRCGTCGSLKRVSGLAPSSIPVSNFPSKNGQLRCTGARTESGRIVSPSATFSFNCRVDANPSKSRSPVDEKPSLWKTAPCMHRFERNSPPNTKCYYSVDSSSKIHLCSGNNTIRSSIVLSLV